MFVHHNTLHAFQPLPFHQGVQAGAAELGARPYLDLAAFRPHMRNGRVTRADLLVEVRRRLGDQARQSLLSGLTLEQFWLCLLTTDYDVDDAVGWPTGSMKAPLTSVPTSHCGAATLTTRSSR